jgi:4-amino-4-deoxy-L-arabinose transferase-like glycosyltransferase
MPATERIALWAALLAAFAVRALHPGQPIVENYVGRQIPTAMVARNLERGSGFLFPQTDVGPFPSLFLVEPPIYPAVVVAIRRVTGLALEPAGRLLSALAVAVAAWGLFGLARPRIGPGAALISLAAFASFPLLLRHGRVFQPDAMMLGALLAGLRCWDGYASSSRRRWLVAGWLLLALAFASKFTSAHVLLPLGVAVVRRGRAWAIALAASALLPAAAWYVHAQQLLNAGSAGGGSVEAVELWLRNLRTFYAAEWSTYRIALGFLLSGSFTPFGILVALWGWLHLPDEDRLWRSWSLAALGSLLVLAKKLEHEYYLFAVAPLVAVGFGHGIVDLARRGNRGRWLAAASCAGLLAMATPAALRSFVTPGAWLGLARAARLVQAHVGRDEWLVAPEPLLYAADRRGCRLAFYDGVQRAAREWAGDVPPGDVVALVELYRSRGARYFADTPRWSGDPDRRALHRAIRRRHLVVVNDAELLLAELLPPPRGDASEPGPAR